MTDVIPETNNRLAYTLGYVFHPAVLAVVTLILVVQNMALTEALVWLIMVAVIVLGPGLVTIVVLKRRRHFTYQRRTRGPIYLVAWLSVIACLALLLVADGPDELVVCVATLAVWVPLQLVINAYVTKISTHVAVAAGCATGSLLLGRLDTPFLQMMTVAVILLTVWARITTRNHTITQVGLGLVVGAGSVLIVFPFLLR